jgi:hypothetical protein
VPDFLARQHGFPRLTRPDWLHGTYVAADTYDVFVSYSRADGRHAAEIDSVLRDKGLKTFFDRRNLAAGLPWVRALEQAIGAAKAAIVLIGPRGLGNTQQYERELAFVRKTRDPAFPVVPVILPETTTDPPFDFVRLLTWIDFSHVTKVRDAPDVLEQLLRAIHASQHRQTRRAMPSAPTVASTHSGKRTPRSSSAAAAQTMRTVPLANWSARCATIRS